MNEPMKKNRGLNLTLLVLVAVVAYFVGKGSRPPSPPPPAILPPPVGTGSVEVWHTKGGLLEVAVLEKSEELHKVSSTWRGTSSASVRLDATYRYSIPVPLEWKIQVDSMGSDRGLITVVAPPFTLETPVAFNSETVQEYSTNGWLRWDKYERLSELRKDITPYLSERGNTDNYKRLALDEARKAVSEYIETMFVPSSLPKKKYIKSVTFSDEMETDITEVVRNRLSPPYHEQPGSQQPHDGIALYNMCSDRAIMVALHYRNLAGTWVTKGWWKVPAGEIAQTDVMTQNQYIYFYAKSDDQDTRFEWYGTDSDARRFHVTESDFYSEDGEERQTDVHDVSFVRRDTGDSWGIYTIHFAPP